MISIKKGILKISHEKDDITKLIFDCCFVLNMLVIFGLYEVGVVASITGIMMFAAAIFIKLGRRDSKITIPYNMVWFGMFVVYASMSGLWAFYVQASSIELILRLIIILLIITSISIYIEKPQDLERLMSLFMLSIFIIIAFELSVVPIDSWLDGMLGRNFSGFNPNEFAFWVSCAEMMAFYRFYIKKDYKFIVLVAFFAFVVLLSSSRKATISIILAPIMMMLLSTYKKNYLLKIAIMCAVIVLIIYLILTNEYLYNTIGRRFVSMYNFTNDKSNKSDNSMFLRSYYIQVAKDIFFESPLFGKGVNNFYSTMIQDYGTKGTYAHNNYWQILSEFGLVGFAIYYSLYLYCIVKLVRNVIVNKSKVSILFLSFMVLLIGLEYGMVTFNAKSTHIVIALVYASTYVGEDDGRKYQYIRNNLNDLEETK